MKTEKKKTGPDKNIKFPLENYNIVRITENIHDLMNNKIENLEKTI